MGTTAAADRYLENTLNKTANGTTINEVNMKSASEEPVIEKLTIINGLKIGYCMYGHGDTAMLFICGGVGCYKKDYPEELLRAFDPNVFKIVCIDPPGYGTSRPPDRKQEVNRCLKDSAFCIELMQQLKIPSYTVLGWSEGARTAIHVADRARQAVKSMILLAAGTRVDLRGAGIFRGMRNTEEWLPEDKAVYLKHYDQAFIQKQWEDLCNVVLEVYDLLGGRFPSDYVLSTLRIPVLVLTGGKDRLCADPNYFASVLSDCKVYTLPYQTHDFHLKRQQWFVKHVTNFLDEVKSKSKTECQFLGSHAFHIQYPKWFAKTVVKFIFEHCKKAGRKNEMQG